MMSVFSVDESKALDGCPEEEHQQVLSTSLSSFFDVGDDDWCQFADVTDVMLDDADESDAGEVIKQDCHQELLNEMDYRPSQLMYSYPPLSCSPSPSSKPSAIPISPGSFRDSSSASAATAAIHQSHAPHTQPPSFGFEMPPQLHPAVSLGVRRISSCYLSLNSEESVVDLLSQLGEGTGSVGSDGIGNGLSDHHSARFNIVKSEDGATTCDCSLSGDQYGTSAKVATTNFVHQAGPYFEQSTSDVLYHDILMHVFTFLDAPALAAFSESARRPNFEVFYFLQLQLQQALLLDKKNDDNDDGDSGSIGSSGTEQGDGDNPASDVVDSLPAAEGDVDHHDIDNVDEIVLQQRRQLQYDHTHSTIAGCASLSRLAAINLPHAQEVVQEYVESNSTLRTMPLSYSLAYARHFLQRHGFSRMLPATNGRTTSAQTLASAALFMTVVGAASIMSTVGGTDAAASMASLTDSFGSELPNVLFRVGFVGSLMGAASRMSDTEQRASMREQAEQMARSAEQMARYMQDRMMMRGSRTVDDSNTTETIHHHHQPRQEPSLQSPSGIHTTFRLPSLFEMRVMLQETMFAARQHQDRRTVLSDPYGHLPLHQEGEGDGDEYEKEGEEKKTEFGIEKSPPAATTNPAFSQSTAERKMPSGCVGAYSRAIHKANIHIAASVKASRKSKFDSMSPEDRQRYSLDFLNACSSNDSFDRVKEMIVCMDVDGFFVGNDGSETCALHTASFHGAEKVVDFLCGGIDDHDPKRDGGLCQVNLPDSNGWTALHFAAGANSVSVLHVLVKHGAKLKIEAHNGYTPLQWAQRLSNQAVADELTKILSSSGSDRGVWMSSQPLTSIANRFFSLIPTH